MKKYFIFSTIWVVLFFVVLTLYLKNCHAAILKAKKDYQKPDTTIRITNGKADTIIEKKSLPWWAK